jgi:hypothetical protein
MGDSIKSIALPLFISSLLFLFSISLTHTSFATGEDQKNSAKNSESEWVVVVHSSNPIEEISATDLKRFLLKEKKFWKEDFKVVPLILDTNHDKFDEFSKKFLHFSKSQYPRFWIEQKFTKGLIRPKEGDVKTLITLIGILKGSISVLPRKEWNQLERPSVKSIEVSE